MKPLRVFALIIAGPLLLLTYLLAQGTTPDVAQYERTLDALRMVTLNDAALQRDVLRARAGLLRSYDPLVRSVEDLRRSAATLRAAEEIAQGEARVEIGRKVEGVAAAVRDQEALLEMFKSRNALLHNSLNYFSHLTQESGTAGGARQSGVTGEIAALSSSMLRFTADPSADVASEVAVVLDRLDRMLAGHSLDNLQDGAGLVAHGRLVVATLPVVDELVSRLQTGSTTERARAVEDAYLAVYRRASARAGFFRILVYAAAVGLVAYVGHLFLRLRSNARMLAERLSFEKLIASVSTQFINLPRDRIEEGIEEGLARLAKHTGADRAHIIIPTPDDSRVERSYSWLSASIVEPVDRSEVLLLIAARLRVEGSEGHDFVHAPRVAMLPDGAEKTSLQRLSIRSWLSIPMAHASKQTGFLILATALTEKHWPSDDIALLRTASEIFANSIARERNEAKHEALEARLREAQRLEAIGTLAGGIAHEFNNILGAILGYGEMALLALHRNTIARRHVEQVIKAGERAQRVVDQVLAFGRRRARQVRPLRAQPVVAEAIEFIRASFPATLTVETRLNAEDAAILGDPTELHQVVMNLCTNAAHAMEERGTLAVDLSIVDVADSLALSHGTLPAGCYLRLIVRDTGHGIEPATMERIFEPFFTTKAIGKGSGLGLSTVHGIVSQHGGALNVESRPGLGTTFAAYFPQTGAAVVDEAHLPQAPVPRGAGETILFVDDEIPLVLLGEEMLAAIGYEPVGFNNSLAALAAFRADPDRFDLVLTDEIMPDMTGTELAMALHEVRPNLPIILMTGYAGHVHMHRLQSAGIRDVLKKPLLSAPISYCLARHLSPRTAMPAASRGDP